MNNGPNQNGKTLEERLAGSSSAAVKTVLRGLICDMRDYVT